MKATLFCGNVNFFFVEPLYASVHFQTGIVSWSLNIGATNCVKWICTFQILTVVFSRGCSSIGRARALHARGTGIDARHLHRLSSPTCFVRPMFLSIWHFIISSWWSILYWKFFNYGWIRHRTLCHIDRSLVQRDKMRPMSARCKLAASCKNVKSFICPIIGRLPVCTWLLSLFESIAASNIDQLR